jgi:L-amino acid N-acyltransferase YncA
MKVRQLLPNDYTAVAQIYEEGMASGMATFETEVPSWAKWNSKFDADLRFVAIVDDQVSGWCALSPMSTREVYRGVAEVTLYVAKRFHQKGIGSSLLSHLIVESEAHGFWTLQASIFPNNSASVILHERNDFRLVGSRENR